MTMYKIETYVKADTRLLTEFPDSKESFISKNLFYFSKEMYKLNCFEISEITEKETMNQLRPGETEITLTGYVMSPAELKEAIEELDVIKSAAPPWLLTSVYRLQTLLTESPRICGDNHF